ncbi:MAG: hypothetical protein K0S21_3257, partial [Rhizobiaceae bacterium]|nr:hypothetical protein [Rhizobiaceae bacterium]
GALQVGAPGSPDMAPSSTLPPEILSVMVGPGYDQRPYPTPCRYSSRLSWLANIHVRCRFAAAGMLPRAIHQTRRPPPWSADMSIELREYDIAVFGDPYKIHGPDAVSAYERTVAGIIHSDIAPRRAGQIVLGRIRKSPGDVEIYPRYKDGLNAEATWKLKDKGHGYNLRKILIWYKPEQWDVSHPPSRLNIPSDLRAFQPAHLRDEVLFHELVHSGRRLDGFWVQGGHNLAPNVDDVTPYANKESAAYNNMEEFATILVTNIYLSEKGAKVFRASHGGAGFPYILDQAQSSSDGFLGKKSNYDLVKMFSQTDPMAPALSEIDTPFNPVRAYLKKNPQDIELNKSLQPR